MTAVASALAPGFSDPVLESQAAFRAVLAALSEPGTIHAIGDGITAPAGLPAASAAVLLTIADYETPLWLPPALAEGEAGAWLRFHCGAAIVAEPAEATFAVIDGMQKQPGLAAFDPGNDQFPDRSTTVLVSCGAWQGGRAVRLSGPGIAGERMIAPAGLRPDFWAEVAANAVRYPLGIDLILCGEGGVIGLPRSTQVSEVG